MTPSNAGDEELESFNAWIRQNIDSQTGSLNIYVGELGKRVRQLLQAYTAQQVREALEKLLADLPQEKDQLSQSTLDDESRCRFYRYGGYNFALHEVTALVQQAIANQGVEEGRDV